MSLTEPPNNGVALWRRVADSIEQAIADGTYPRDTRLPGELEIAEVHRVNRHTVRRALAALAERGLVAPNAAVAPMSKRPHLLPAPVTHSVF
jgi:GntR family phosphonate transport system transcriptional regulator